MFNLEIRGEKSEKVPITKRKIAIPSIRNYLHVEWIRFNSRQAIASPIEIT